MRRFILMTMMARMKTMRVAVAQMTSGPDVAANLDAAERLVRKVAEWRAELVVLPECFAYLGPTGDARYR